MIIRDAVVGDEHVITEITIRAWQAAYRHILPPSRLDTMTGAGREQDWHEHLVKRDWIILLAEEDETELGLIALGSARDPDCGDEVAELFSIYMDPGAWRRGIGRQLLDQGLERLPGDRIREVVLWVFEENHQARRFYESTGFELEPDSRRLIEVWGSRHAEVRYRLSMPGVPSGDQA
jgi:RimJ/RimL family protein N-acetyltransferase